MEWKSIRSCGNICEFYKKIDLQAGKNKTGEFFNETLIEFAKVSTKLFDTTGDFTFAYKERQLSSIFLPAFFNLSFGTIQEVPTRRKKYGQESSHGWLDYWVQKNEQLVYLVEVKHAWQFLNGDLCEDTQKKINKSIEQLKSISNKEVANLSKIDTTFKLSLLVLPIWRSISDKIDIIEYDEYKTVKEDLEKTAKNILNKINSKTSWLGIWSTPDRMQYAFQPNNTKHLQTFPGVILIATLV